MSQDLGKSSAVDVGMPDLAVADINGKDEGSRRIETLLIDLDDTLYQVRQAPELVRENIQGMLSHWLHSARSMTAQRFKQALSHNCTCSVHEDSLKNSPTGHRKDMPRVLHQLWYDHGRTCGEACLPYLLSC